ncbi:hypothetical protein V565_199100 [Rhizoctonia solani 123E]|uniref:Uncharacterized protein n=1 Tax=Rhizoctonia solani 123E TaxID=1423351 RepID=A0A074RM61_9AGAM|nr:hypothetical protein V565_199100 [Rhizoctonia solani 123E]
MLFDYSPNSTEQRNIDLYFPYAPGIEFAELDGMKLEAIIPDTRNLLPPYFTKDLPHERTSSTQPPSQKPRVVSDSAVILGQSHNNFANTLQDLPHGPRHQRIMSVGCQPYFATQGFETSSGDSTHNATRTPPYESIEKSEDHFRTFRDLSGTASGLGYDGTRPIAYIQVNDPQRYSLRTTDPAPDLHNTALFQKQSRNKAHSKTNLIYVQPAGDRLICDQQPTTHGQAVNQPSAHESALDWHHHSNAQMIPSSNSGSEPRQFSSTKPMAVLANKAEDYELDHYQPTTHYDTSTQTASETLYSKPHALDRDGDLNGNIDDPCVASTPVHSTIHTQSISPPIVPEGLNSAGLNYALEIPHNGLQGQIIAEGLVGNATAPKFNIVHSEGGLAPILRDNEAFPFSQRLDHCQPSASYDYPPHSEYTWSNIPSSPVAQSEFQSTTVVAVPAPRRSLNFGAFLTPDPPCQISNIDLPSRPNTSPPRRTSAPNGRLRLLPNTGRRRSEQTWQSYGSLSDRAQLPQLLPPPSIDPVDTNQPGGSYSHAPPSLAISQTQTRGRDHIRPEVNYAVESLETCGLISVEIPGCPPLANNDLTVRPLIQRPTASSVREELSVFNSGQLQGHALANSPVVRNQLSEQHDTEQSNSDQMRQRAPLQTQSVVCTTQSKSPKQRLSQKSQSLDPGPPTQVIPSTTERHGSERKTATKRRYSHSNPENTSAAKKRKPDGKIPEVIITKPDTLIQPSTCQNQNLPTTQQDCVYFDVNTWRGDNIANQGVLQDLSVGSNAHAPPQSGSEESVQHSPGQPTGDRSGKPSEKASSSKLFQASHNDGEVASLASSESWLPVDQDDGTNDLQYMSWGPSVDMLLDQTLAFDIATEQYVTALNLLERPLALETTPVFPLAPSNFEVDRLLVDCYNSGMFSAVA